MKEEKDKSREEGSIGAVDRFKRSLISGRTKYFDVSEFEEIVEQLLEEGDIQSSEIAAKQGIQIHPNAVPLQLKYAQILLNKGLNKKSLKYLSKKYCEPEKEQSTFDSIMSMLWALFG